MKRFLSRLTDVGYARLMLVVVSLLLTALVAGGVQAAAPLIVVNSTADPGDGVCDAAECTLREAIRTSNSVRGAAEIVIPAGLFQLSVPGAAEDSAASGDLDITDAVVIRGAGAAQTIVDGGELDRVFHIVRNVEVKLKDLTIRGGHAGEGGGILNRGTLHVLNSVITANHVGYQAPDYGANAGGGIYNSGSLILTDSQVVNNETDRNMGEGMGGAIWNGGKLTITRSDFRQNWAAAGGAIFNDGGVVTLTICNLTDNTARFFGGALENWHAGTVTISRCTISGNNESISNVGGKLWLINSTVSNNPSYRTNGGIGNWSGTVSISGSTISHNGSNSTAAGGIMGSVTLRGSIVAHNANSDCAAPVISEGYNLDGDGSCGLNGPGDISGDPLLGPLQNNGGDTATRSLLPGSPALDAIPLGECGLAMDQRGIRRPRDGNGDGVAWCDIGAVEMNR